MAAVLADRESTAAMLEGAVWASDVPSANTNLTTIIIAERAAGLISTRAKGFPQCPRG